MKSHYRGHKMAVWLNLIPQLHRPGDDDVSMRHHHFRERGDHIYAGKIISFAGRESSFNSYFSRLRTIQLSSALLLFRTGSGRMVHATATDRHDSDELFFDHCLQHVHGRRGQPHRGHYSDSGRFRGRCRITAETGVSPLLQHDHCLGDHRGRRLHPPGPKHADLRWHLLSAGSRQETCRHGLQAERTRVFTNDYQDVYEALRKSAIRSRTTSLVHNPREKSFHPGSTAATAAAAARAVPGRPGQRAVEQERLEIRSRDQRQCPQGSDPSETAC